MRKILVSMLLNVGDVIMMTSALDLIKQKFPQSEVGVLIRPEAEGIVKDNPLVDEVIIYPYRSGSLLHGLRSLLKSIRDGKYDFFLSLDRRSRSAWAALLCGLKKRVGPDMLFPHSSPKLWPKLLYSDVIKMSQAEYGGSLVEIFQLITRRALNVSGSGAITLPPISREDVQRIKGILGDGRRPLVGLCVKTNFPGKTWPKEGFVNLMTRLHQDFRPLMYITGGPEDRPYVDELIKELAPVRALNLAGQTKLMDVRVLASISDLCITLDNGAAHLMANSGLKNLVCILMATTSRILADSMPQATFIQLEKVENSYDSSRLKTETEQIFQTVARLLKGSI